ncbi:Acetyltransferase NoeT [Neorhizobium galegae bv. officinalis]|uniref:Acetyltransferase NoeT n=1 Tax=Neorhizobium galegae bv. officinalis TaxID=323656 RepID=A0A0T7H4Z4_NEOGA|nr:acyltransferase family protein [Neorhizobium galegae]CDZ40817.1 Acetyltransferase NoeT [Neorhizobium galegae bv. officinalis]CDZ54606.1 Acetyltransferase NoeT [Neorhizobium galegae bv. officinalis]
MPRDFRADVHALRGLAALLVVFYHTQVASFGYLGVDIFFVISGFLITGLIATELEQARFSFWEFYYRRAKRLLPAAYVVIALTTIAAPFFLSDMGLRDFRTQVLGALTFTSNIVLWTQADYFGGSAETKPLLHFWSLAVEEQCYLLLPAFLALSPKRWWLTMVSSLLVASLALCLYVAFRDPSAAFYLLPTRFWEIAIGSLGALLPVSARVTAKFAALRLPALVLILLIPFGPSGLQNPIVNAALVCLATLILLLSPNKDNVAVRSMARIGDISYSLYLIHWPVLVYVRAAWLEEPPSLAIYAAVAFSVVASLVLHRFVEKPFQRGFVTSRGRMASGLVAATVLLGFALSVDIGAAESKGGFSESRRINYGLARECDRTSGSRPQGILEACQTTDRPELLVWGDSFAMALVPGLAKTVGEAGLAQLTMSGCSPAIGVAAISKRAVSLSFGEDCIRFNDSVLNTLKNRPEIRTVVISSPFDAPDSKDFTLLKRRDGTFTEVETSVDGATEGIKSLVEAVRALGRRVVIVAPPPVAGFDIGDCLERKMNGGLMLGRHSDCKIDVIDYRRMRSRTLDLLNQVAVKADVEVVSYHDFLCDDTKCRTEIDGKFLYRDSGHLSYQGSEIIALKTGLAERLIRAAR